MAEVYGGEVYGNYTVIAVRNVRREGLVSWERGRDSNVTAC